MPPEDRFGLPLGTKSDAAAERYVAAVDPVRAANAGVEALFDRTLSATQDFALTPAARA